jgi:hypothetical protein
MRETDHFFDLGYGWLCKHCTAECAETKQNWFDRSRADFPEAKDDREKAVSQLRLARWTDASRQALYCPHCGLEELVSKF